MPLRSKRLLARLGLATAMLPAALWASRAALAQERAPVPPRAPSGASAPAGSPMSTAIPTPASLPPLEGPRPAPDSTLTGDDAGVEHVTFDVAVARALARNPTAQEAVEEVHRFHAIMEQVRASSLPTLYGYGTYTRIDHDRVENGAI